MNQLNKSLEQVVATMAGDGHSSVFVPMCLYSKNFLRSKQVEKLILELARYNIRATFVVADYLHGLNLVLRGYSSQTASRNADIAGKNLAKMVSKIVEKHAVRSCTVYRWHDIASRTGFERLLGHVEQAFGSVPSLFALANDFMQFQKNRAAWKEEHPSGIEHRYLFSELAMSIYMTELEAIGCELWEQAPAPTGPDPLAIIYERYLPELRNWTGKEQFFRQLYRLPPTW